MENLSAEELVAEGHAAAVIIHRGIRLEQYYRCHLVNSGALRLGHNDVQIPEPEPGVAAIYKQLGDRVDIQIYGPPRANWPGPDTPINPHTVTPLNDFQKNVVNFVRFRSEHPVERSRRSEDVYIDLLHGVVRAAPSGSRNDHTGFIGGNPGCGKSLAVIASACPRTLIICPDHLVLHWHLEIKKHAPTTGTLITIKTFDAFFARHGGRVSTHMRLFVDEAQLLSRARLATIEEHYSATVFFVTSAYEKIIVPFYASESLVVSPPREAPAHEVRRKLIRCPMCPEIREALDRLHLMIRYAFEQRTQIKCIHIRKVLQLIQHFSAGFTVADVESSLAMAGVILGIGSDPETTSYDQLPMATAPGFGDGCPVCLGDFVQCCQVVPCGHRFCYGCLLAMGERLRVRCASCRTPTTSIARAFGSVAPAQAAVIPRRSTGKVDALVLFFATLSETDRVIVFTAESDTAREIAARTGALVAFDSVDALYEFNQARGARMVVVSTAFISGIDVPDANYIFVLDRSFDMSESSKMVNRLMRFSPVSRVVNVVEFLYDRSFDTFVRWATHLESISFSKGTLALYLYFIDHDTPGTAANRERAFLLGAKPTPKDALHCYPQ